MELTSKQRAYLRGEAQTIDPIVMIGKDGLTENVTAALDEALTHHELVKVKFQQYKEDVKEIAFRCAELTSSVLVATTGFTAVFYRMNEKSEERIYSLPR
ncbi:MAG: YhbY family RNA-binding protein [Bullifex sp.]|nr:YhbY family RNA-binding protein [Spirochaetales bacterium]MDY2816451.1 YhbY family RNA-binding protein [Bullifex sp.]MDY4797893.1 YhbY family RNA-binding protein [Bullifex sp.]